VAQADWLDPKVGGHLAPFLYSSRELLQWLCYADSAINIVVVIIIVLGLLLLLSEVLYERKVTACAAVGQIPRSTERILLLWEIDVLENSDQFEIEIIPFSKFHLTQFVYVTNFCDNKQKSRM